ncbi:hypothetical protein ZWY2020_011157 [Hordeum vulgare]|nr:hypothetical protein ZWY2020_011157 [Hordeum vulgare]
MRSISLAKAPVAHPCSRPRHARSAPPRPGAVAAPTLPYGSSSPCLEVTAGVRGGLALPTRMPGCNVAPLRSPPRLPRSLHARAHGQEKKKKLICKRGRRRKVLRALVAVELRPPWLILLVCMSFGAHLIPPSLELHVVDDVHRTWVVVRHIIKRPLLDGIPN